MKWNVESGWQKVGRINRRYKSVNLVVILCVLVHILLTAVFEYYDDSLRGRGRTVNMNICRENKRMKKSMRYEFVETREQNWPVIWNGMN
jgi:predicted alpha/beta hydrolase